MRSQGQVRFIKISARLQMMAAGAAAALVAVWLVTMAAMAVSSILSTRDRLALLDREAKVATAESRVSAYRSNIDTVAQDIARRQAFIEEVVRAHLGDLPATAQTGETVSDSAGAAAETVRKVSAAVPEAAGLARIEARQLAFVESLTRAADRRAALASARLASLGLNPQTLLARLDDPRAQGGPLIRLAGGRDGRIDPRFERLGLSLARMETLERSVRGLPQTMPASLEFISSGYGYRADPFTGEGAFHAGLDFRGPYGAPIYAAARGRISFAGVRSGYGNVIEIDHGNGLMTRYAHMSRLAAQPGQLVEPGAVIGAIGNSGRSTGPHLHFEVRLNDQALNPRPFLEAASNVSEKPRDRAAAGN